MNNIKKYIQQFQFCVLNLNTRVNGPIIKLKAKIKNAHNSDI